MSHLEQRIAALRSIERRIKSDAAWMRSTRETLLMQVKNTLPLEAAAPRESVREAIRHFVGNAISSIVRTPAMAVVSLVAIATGGSFMSVSAAERSYPGDFLYGLKLATEQARLAWVSSKNDKLKLKTEFTDRRVQELKEVANVRRDDEGVKQVAEILKRDMNTIKEQLADVQDASPAEAVEAAKLVDQKSLEVMNALQETKPGLGAETKQKMTEAQSVAADAGVKAIEVLVEKHEEASSTVAVADVTQAITSHANAVLSVTKPDAAGATSTSSTVTLLVQSLASSTAAASTSTLELPKIIDQMKGLTTLAFAEQKAKEQLATASSTAAGSPSGGSSTSTPSTASSSTTSISNSPPASTTSSTASP